MLIQYMSGNKDTYKNVFVLDFEPDNKLVALLLKIFRKPLEAILDFKGLNHIHRSGFERQSSQHFSQTLLDVMKIEVEIDKCSLDNIPKNGKVVFVANHPFGGIEGVIMGAILKKTRPDIRIMANKMLERIPELRDIFFFVNPFNTANAARENLASMKETIRHLNEGGAFGVFPAGEVSHRTWGRSEVIDPEWSDSITRIIRKTGATVVPMYFDGQNGLTFQLAGLIHPRLRTLLLPRQFSNKQGRKIRVVIGKAISPKKTESFDDDQTLTRYLMQRSYLLKSVTSGLDAPAKPLTNNGAKQDYEEVIPAVDPNLLASELDSLDKSQLLLENNDMQVWFFASSQAPNILREIGRLREITFRLTEEGTGKSIDTDKYDDYYNHLLVWNKENVEVVGAYRLGRTDDILSEHGEKGLYTTTLFRMKPQFLKEINPALEMGRSFIRKEYQRSFAPLMLLWKGIGQYVIKNPKYNLLFGPVSISNDYSRVSKELIVMFLERHHYIPEFAKHVQPVNPFSVPGKPVWMPYPEHGSLIDTDDINDVVSMIEHDQKGIPILVKQYLKLGGKMLAFNVDPDFADVLDGLVLVDLTKTDEKMQHRYMGIEGLPEFMQFHGRGEK